MWTKRIISSIAVTGIALGTAIPAFAYVTESYETKPTRRAIRDDRNQNAPKVGDIEIFGGERTTAVNDNTGRNLLPLRGIIRSASLRNANRHLLGAERGGKYGSLDYTSQGDNRRTPSVADTTSRSPLPPSLVQTGRISKYLKPSRRAIRGNRDLNSYNRR